MSQRLKHYDDKRSATYPKEEIRTRGELSICMTRGKAEEPIWYRDAQFSGETEWNATPFITASARHDWDQAFQLVSEWLKREGM